MPNPPRPRPFTPRSRAETIAPLEQVKEACQADPAYMAAVAQIIADVLNEANSVTAPDPEAPQPTARSRRLWTAVMERANAR